MVNPPPSSQRAGLRAGLRAARGSAVAAGGGGGAPSLAAQIAEKNAQSPVVVYSKSWCPFCVRVKGLLLDLGTEAKVIELDEVVEGAEVQDALLSITGVRTVPQVFVGGEFLGGCDDTEAAHRAGQLVPLLEAAGAL